MRDYDSPLDPELRAVRRRSGTRPTSRGNNIPFERGTPNGNR